MKPDFLNTPFQKKKGCNCGGGDKNETWIYKHHKIIFPPNQNIFFYHRWNRVVDPARRDLKTLSTLISEILED